MSKEVAREILPPPDHMMSEEVAREILPPPVTLLPLVKNSNFCESVQVSRKPRFVLGSHDVYRGGT
ncbi:hypothetical protein V1477_009392 [Vespula maculifrons]|uniref:Uncharacterized protein n=1 Tax=Vespula maculifrons TaxID=7453 RepID=A0ABD2C9Q0_VESMC